MRPRQFLSIYLKVSPVQHVLVQMINYGIIVGAVDVDGYAFNCPMDQIHGWP